MDKLEIGDTVVTSYGVMKVVDIEINYVDPGQGNIETRVVAPVEIDGWVRLKDDYKSSTVADFIGGYNKHTDDSVEHTILIWKRHPDTELTSSKDNVPPEWANYVIEHKTEEELYEHFAETRVGAQIKVNRIAEEVNNAN